MSGAASVARTSSSNPVVKLALVACLAVISTGATSWLVFGQDKVTRSEMQPLVRDAVGRAPTMVQHTRLDGAVIHNAESIGKLEKLVKESNDASRALTTQVAVLVSTLKDQ